MGIEAQQLQRGFGDLLHKREKEKKKLQEKTTHVSFGFRLRPR
jgi:hypothetical protein